MATQQEVDRERKYWKRVFGDKVWGSKVKATLSVVGLTQVVIQARLERGDFKGFKRYFHRRSSIGDNAGGERSQHE